MVSSSSSCRGSKGVSYLLTTLVGRWFDSPIAWYDIVGASAWNRKRGRHDITVIVTRCLGRLCGETLVY